MYCLFKDAPCLFRGEAGLAIFGRIMFWSADCRDERTFPLFVCFYDISPPLRGFDTPLVTVGFVDSLVLGYYAVYLLYVFYAGFICTVYLISGCNAAFMGAPITSKKAYILWGTFSAWGYKKGTKLLWLTQKRSKNWKEGFGGWNAGDGEKNNNLSLCLKFWFLRWCEQSRAGCFWARSQFLLQPLDPRASTEGHWIMK